MHDKRPSAPALALFTALAALGAAACGSSGATGSDGGDGGTKKDGPAPGEVGDTSGGDHPSSDGAPATNAAHQAMLESLGFKTKLDPLKDSTGALLPDTYHPLRKRFAAMRPLQEIYIAGAVFDGTPEHFFDDKQTGYAKLKFNSDVDNAWTKAEFKNAIAADVDGDGRDEIVAVYYINLATPATSILKYLVLNARGQPFRTGIIDGAAVDGNKFLWNGGGGRAYAPALAKGDLDGDGKDEIAVGFSRLYVLDELEKATPKITTLTPQATGDPRHLFVAAGDVDGDAVDELAISYSENNVAKYKIFDGGDTSKVLKMGDIAIDLPNNGGKAIASEAQVAIGDVDGDHLGEIVFYGRAEGNNWRVYVMEDARDGAGFGWGSLNYTYGVSGEIPKAFALLDWDGDGVKEILAHKRAIRIAKGMPMPAKTYDVFEWADGIPQRVAVGDVTGDGKDDVIYEWYGIRVASQNVLLQKDDTVVWQTGSATPWESLTLVTCNVDDDSAIVRWDGQHELLFTDPHLLAVLASPPYKTGAGQDLNFTNTTFGKTKGDMTETMQSMGFEVGFSIGSKVDYLFGSSEFKLTVEQSFDWTSSESHSVQKSYSYTTGGGENKVVFTTVPFDVYYYTVVSSPRKSDVGEIISINIPRDPQTLGTTPEFYNERNGSSVDVDAAILQHTLGDPKTYMTVSERDAILVTNPGAYWNGPMTVNEGTGSSMLWIESAAGTGHGMSYDLNVKLEWSSGGKSGPQVGGSVGFHEGLDYTVKTTMSTYFQALVAAIPGPKYVANQYSFGLLAYPQSAGGDQFLVVNYWVQ